MTLSDGRSRFVVWNLISDASRCATKWRRVAIQPRCEEDDKDDCAGREWVKTRSRQLRSEKQPIRKSIKQQIRRRASFFLTHPLIKLLLQCLDEEKVEKDSEREERSDTERSCVTTSKESPSPPSVVSRDEEESSESLVSSTRRREVSSRSSSRTLSETPLPVRFAPRALYDLETDYCDAHRH